MRSLWALVILFAALCMSKSHAKTLINDEGVEVLYFFSYHCSGCFAMKDYISLWESVNGQKVRRIPVYYDGQWEPGAYLYAMTSLLRNRSQLNQSEFDRNNFAFIQKSKLVGRPDRDHFIAEITEYGFGYSNLTLLKAWKESEIYLNEVKMLLQDASEDHIIQTPSLRVSNKDKVIWIPLNTESENPGIELLGRLSNAIKELK